MQLLCRRWFLIGGSPIEALNREYLPREKNTDKHSTHRRKTETMSVNFAVQYHGERHIKSLWWERCGVRSAVGVCKNSCASQLLRSYTGDSQSCSVFRSIPWLFQMKLLSVLDGWLISLLQHPFPDLPCSVYRACEYDVVCWFADVVQIFQLDVFLTWMCFVSMYFRRKWDRESGYCFRLGYIIDWYCSKTQIDGCLTIMYIQQTKVPGMNCL